MAVTKLYNGTVELDFDSRMHSYMVDGVLAPSVTKITGIIDKPALIYWAVNQTANRIAQLWQPEREYSAEQIRAAIDDAKSSRFRTSDKALNIGSQAHDWIEQYVKAKMYGFDPPEIPGYTPVKNAVESYLQWEKDNDVSYIMSERKVLSLEHMFTGTVDLVCKVNGKHYVADLKTSKGIYNEYYLQVAAYAGALIEEHPLMQVDGVMVIRVPKEGGDVEIGVNEDVEGLYKVFLSCLDILRWSSPKWGRG